MEHTVKFDLLETLCGIPATAGDEGTMRDFVVDYLLKHQDSFHTKPILHYGKGFQDMVIAVFGTPRTAVFAHMDTVGYMVAHDRGLVKIGNPKARAGSTLLTNRRGVELKVQLEINKTLNKKNNVESKEVLLYAGKHKLAPGTALTYEPGFKETKQFVQGSYMDNRLGVWTALKLAETISDGILVFSTYEEHGGGAAQWAGKFIQDTYSVNQALICDVTLLSESIKHHKGVAISIRDRGIPRQSFVRKIVELAKGHHIPHQLEVEAQGGSDGLSLQHSSYLWDWCFIGPCESNYHQPGEKVSKRDIHASLQLYKLLLSKL